MCSSWAYAYLSMISRLRILFKLRTAGSWRTWNMMSRHYLSTAENASAYSKFLTSSWRPTVLKMG